MNTEIVIIGAGVTGLTAGMQLGDRAVVLERDNRPGGVAKTHCFDGGYWFDNTVHFLLLRDKDIETQLMPLLGDGFKHSPLVVWVETNEGTVRYPFQLNLGGLNKEAQGRCVADFEKALKEDMNVESYRDFLLHTFGQSMCDIFFFPYNQKCWKFPLSDMTSSGQVWNIHQPTMEEVLDGVYRPNITRGNFNTNGYYPCPNVDAPQRGIELLPQALARNVKNLRLRHDVFSIDLNFRCILGSFGYIEYEHCLSTIPLNKLMNMCSGVPDSLMKEVDKLKWTKLLSIGISVEGKRRKNTGHYRYYANPYIPFNKLIYTTEFDPHNAPEEGFGLLLEVKLPNELYFTQQIVDDVIATLYDIEVLNTDDTIIGTHTWEVDPAYVIFTKETPSIIEHCKEFLAKYNITTLGRYGGWEYSSMAENIRDGFNYAKQFTI
jgi:protoporphyrinogen oxidase